MAPRTELGRWRVASPRGGIPDGAPLTPRRIEIGLTAITGWRCARGVGAGSGGRLLSGGACGKTFPNPPNDPAPPAGLDDSSDAVTGHALAGTDLLAD
jgi:hypothetical protein